MVDLRDSHRAHHHISTGSKAPGGVGVSLVRISGTTAGLSLDGTIIERFSSGGDIYSSDTASKSVAKASAERALDAILAQQQGRNPYGSGVVINADTTKDRYSTGAWTGSIQGPTNYHDPMLTHTPVIVEAPLYFPIIAGQKVTFAGKVDVPFVTMDGDAGVRYTSPGVPNPATEWNDGGINLGSYFVLGACDGVKQFIVRIGPNRVWTAVMNTPPAGLWSFQVVTYENQTDADADTNRILVGQPWKEIDRPGDVRQYWNHQDYSPEQTSMFSDVVITRDTTNTIEGTLAAFTPRDGFTYQILVTEETDVDYAYKLHPVVSDGAFTITSTTPIGGTIALRLVEQYNDCTTAQIGIGWSEGIDDVAGNLPGLRMDYYAIDNVVPGFPTSFVGIQDDKTFEVTLAPTAVGRLRVVNTDTKRVWGQYQMVSGLPRSFNVPADLAGQDPTSGVYYDGFNDTSFIYDMGVSLIALMQRNEETAAAALVDAILAAQNPDGSWNFAVDQAAITEHSTRIIRCGAIAWLVYALLIADQVPVRSWFATKTTAAAKAGLDFLLTYKNSLGLINGGKGTDADTGYIIPWWSTEHNLDCWWAFNLADELYGSTIVDYRGTADVIKQRLLQSGVGWDQTNNIFWQGGTVTAGVNTPDGQHALDTHTWGSVALAQWGYTDWSYLSLRRAFQVYFTTDKYTLLSGYCPVTPVDGYPSDTVVAPWYEGSFGAAVAIRMYNDEAANGLMQELARGQLSDGTYPYMLQADPGTGSTKFPSLIAAAWNVLAFTGPGTPYTPIFWVNPSQTVSAEDLSTTPPLLNQLTYDDMLAVPEFAQLANTVGDVAAASDSAYVAQGHELQAETAELSARLSQAQNFPSNFVYESKFWTGGQGQAGSPEQAAATPLPGTFTTVSGEGYVYTTEADPQNCNSFGPVGLIPGVPGTVISLQVRSRAITDNTGGTPSACGLALIYVDATFNYTEFKPGVGYTSHTVADGWQELTYEFTVPAVGDSNYSPYYRPSFFYNVVGASADPLAGSDDPQGNQQFQVAWFETLYRAPAVNMPAPNVISITTTGAGTYTPTTACAWARVFIMGGGGGGGGGGGAGAGDGTDGDDTTFGSWTAGGGKKGGRYTAGVGLGGAGGTLTPPGSPPGYNYVGGQYGGSGPGSYTYAAGGMGGGGQPGLLGGTAIDPPFASGMGGPGGGAEGTAGPGGGGGQGVGAEFVLSGATLVATSYSVGAGGSGGTAGTGGKAGTAGARGRIVIEEHFA